MPTRASEGTTLTLKARLFFMSSLALCLSMLVLLTSCYGRLSDSSSGRELNAKDYGLTDSKPALIVFAAAWCKPCMAEIHSLNRAQAQLGDRLQVTGFAVEGAQKGVPAAPKDTALFQSPHGERPEYPLTLDPSWKLFDQLRPSAGRSLPTMVFVDSNHRVVHLVQRSMEYETELLPLLQNLVAGQTSAPLPPQTPKDPQPDPSGKIVNQTFANWTALPGHGPDSEIYQKMQAAWMQGLEDFAFTEDDMPFSNARLRIFAYDDGRSKPVSGIWVAADTGCRLTVYFHPDGSYDRSEGVCR